MHARQEQPILSSSSRILKVGCNNLNNCVRMSQSNTASSNARPDWGSNDSQAVTPSSITSIPRTRLPTPKESERCPVCGKATCKLKTHAQYARSRRLAKVANSPHKSETHILAVRLRAKYAVPGDDSFVTSRVVEIAASTVDPFVHFPFPLGVKAEVQELFKDCKPMTSIARHALSKLATFFAIPP